jgi:alanine racemase
MLYRTWVEVSLDRIVKNLRAIQRTVGRDVVVSPVVKANAYGHGARMVARCLDAAGAHWLAVSTTEEGVELRDAGVRADILVMGDFLPFEEEAVVSHRLTPVIHSLARLRDYDRLASSSSRQLSCHLKIDTGMGRLGCRATAAELIDALRQARHVKLEGLMTHFASASDFGSPQTSDQIAAFGAFRAALRSAGITPPLTHLASSGPIAHGLQASWGNMVRPGLLLYGYAPPASGNAPRLMVTTVPALTWKAAVVEVRDLAAGDSVGYGARWRASRAARIAVLAVGYADGVPPELANRGKVIIGGHELPIVGAVSMDLTCVDVTECACARPGAAATLLGPVYDAVAMARDAGVDPRTILCRMGRRVSRVYSAQ